MVDTGADESAIPEWLAKKLGHEIRNEEVNRREVRTGGGVVIVYMHTFEIDVFGYDNNDEPTYEQPFHTIGPLRLGVLPAATPVLLGVHDFLINFTLVINYPKGTFSLL